MIATAVLFAITAVFVLVWAWRQLRVPLPDDPDEHVEQCDECLRPLAWRDTYELRSVPLDDAFLGAGELGGGTYVSAVYCAECYPPDAPPPWGR